jgi:hypothetical protein
MKKLILFLCLAAFIGPKVCPAKTVPETTTSTAKTADPVDITKNVPWASGDDGKDHRLHSDNLGNLYTSGGTSIPGQNLPYTGLTTTASALFPFAVTITTAAGQTGIVAVAAISGKTIVVMDWFLSTSTTARITLHHGATVFRSATGTANVIDDQFFPANGGDVKSQAPSPSPLQNSPVCFDVDGPGAYTVGGHYITQ